MTAATTGWLVAALLLAAGVLAGPAARWTGPRAARLRVRRPWWVRAEAASRPEDELLRGARLAERAAALLRAGVAPTTAWQHAARPPVAALPGTASPGTASSGTAPGGTARALPADGGVDLGGAPPAVQAVWRLAERTGAPAADALAACAAGLREDADAHAALRVATAGARVSARTVALLPLVGLALGAALGAPPWQTLLATGAGRGCAVLGVGLLLAGRHWTQRMVRSAAGGLG
ncbi:hypothetical protein GTR02_20580 [Kineococcus sp. R8]|uniref:hypothetical protein n=1 Tax=Kineococcus siccus TaxID=2696567 RepID=UPI00141244CA|nr:hypothetical protein [Kineococcus siccus]NAZ84205.1 hypothetical protein [Kineococcus siccus]